VNAYVKGGFSKDAETVEALAQYARFPHWMWRNTVSQA
jgi:erythromycin esterase-like protein